MMTAEMPEVPSTEDAQTDAIWGHRCGVLHKAWVQVRYHRHRQRFFDLADKITKSLTVLLGASLMGQWLKDYLPYVASAISALGLLALVFGYSDRKQAHKELAEQAAALIDAIEQVPARELTAGKTSSWGASYARLCAKAPPPLRTLTLMCEREQATADGHPDHIPLQPWRKRVMADICS
ncbi:MAG: hypothetical protein K2Y10_00420 [Burkholderiaceae bacterium]|nr:hypothetical protein [Burkholderiaceae bacterium]